MRRSRTAALVLAGSMDISATPAAAYEYQTGAGKACGGAKWVDIQANVYGDGNLYSNYGFEYGAYNWPYNSPVYLYAQTIHHSVSATAAEAENYVNGAVGRACRNYF